MPYKDKEEKLRYNREYYLAHRQQILAEAREIYRGNREVILKNRIRNKKSEARHQKHRDTKLRTEIVIEFGGKCACCEEKEFLFLELDHINDDGYKERTNGKRPSSRAFYRKVRKEGFPKDKYQLLCANCNQGKARNKGVCPHKLKNREFYSQLKWSELISRGTSAKQEGLTA